MLKGWKDYYKVDYNSQTAIQLTSPSPHHLMCVRCCYKSCVHRYIYITVKEKLLFWQIIWLLQVRDYPSYANSKKVVHACKTLCGRPVKFIQVLAPTAFIVRIVTQLEPNSYLAEWQICFCSVYIAIPAISVFWSLATPQHFKKLENPPTLSLPMSHHYFIPAYLPLSFCSPFLPISFPVAK